MRSRPFVALLALLLPAALGGCSGTGAIAMAGISAATFAMTDKFPADHVATWVTGEECSALQAEQTGQYCRTDEEIAAAEAAARPGAMPAIYCYRTIGE